MTTPNFTQDVPQWIESASWQCITALLMLKNQSLTDDDVRGLHAAFHGFIAKHAPQPEAKEVAVLESMLANEEQACMEALEERDTAIGFCDLFAATILGEDINWSCHETKWQEALDMMSNGKTIEVSGIMLRRSGDHAIVEAEVDGKWKEVIREYIDAPFSHIVEPAGIADAKESELNSVPDGVEATPTTAATDAASGVERFIVNNNGFQMGKITQISWCHSTFNPWRGCSKVHTGCANCYAEATSKRNETILGTWGPNGTRVVAAERAWSEVLKWNKAAAKLSERPRVFCASLADVFEDWSGPMLNHNGETLLTLGGDWFTEPSYPYSRLLTLVDVRRRLFDLIDATPALDWLLLTKRPENVRKYWPSVDVQTQEQADDRNERGELYRRNVWIGTSISDQETFDKFAPKLYGLDDLAPVRFLSAEPLVGPVEMLYPDSMFPNGPRRCCDGRECGCHGLPVDPWALYGINLVIVGGESGPGARPCSVEWVRDIVRQCTEANVACFVKQLGANVLSRKPFDENEWTSRPVKYRYVGDADFIRVEVSDPKAGKPDEWPEDLRVRQMPEVCR